MASKMDSAKKVVITETFEVLEYVTYKDILDNVAKYDHLRFYDPADKRIYWVRDAVEWMQDNPRKKLSKVLIVEGVPTETVTLV